MCKRKTDDPLVRMFLDRWRLNPLAIPREHAEPGDVWLKRDRQVIGPVELNPLLTAPVELPEPRLGDQLAGMSQTASHSYDARVGLGLLEAFLAALGAAGVVQKVRAGYERQHAQTVSFRFTEATRDSIDPGRLGRALAGVRFDPDHPLADPDNRYFVAAAVVRTPSVSIKAHDERDSTVGLGADVLAVVNADASVSVKASEEGEVSYAGKVPLAIGVELYELTLRDDGTLGMGLPGAAAFRAGRAVPVQPAFLGDDDEALIAPDAPPTVDG